MKYRIALMQYSKREHRVESYSVREMDRKEAERECEALNRLFGHTYGGFGPYYAPKRTTDFPQ